MVEKGLVHAIAQMLPKDLAFVEHRESPEAASPKYLKLQQSVMLRLVLSIWISLRFGMIERFLWLLVSWGIALVDLHS